MNKITAKNAADIPSGWARFTGQRLTTVRVRNCAAREEFSVSWQDSKLVAEPEKDIIVIQDNGAEYPCKIDIFEKTYEATLILGRFRKKEKSTLISIPEGYSVDIETLEGKLNLVSYPDYIVVGINGELYANTKDFVEKNLNLVALPE
jgi:hypothetical protein